MFVANFLSSEEHCCFPVINVLCKFIISKSSIMYIPCTVLGMSNSFQHSRQQSGENLKWNVENNILAMKLIGIFCSWCCCLNHLGPEVGFVPGEEGKEDKEGGVAGAVYENSSCWRGNSNIVTECCGIKGVISFYFPLCFPAGYVYRVWRQCHQREGQIASPMVCDKFSRTFTRATTTSLCEWPWMPF